MITFREIKLPSGATLKVAPASFDESKALAQAFADEIQKIKISKAEEVGNMVKDLLCIGFTSKKIEACLAPCFARCVYSAGSGDLKLSLDIFEDVTARQDYLTVCKEVMEENISPFMKSLYAQFGAFLGMMESTQA